MTLPDYVVFENIVLVLTKRLRSAFNFLSHFFICAHVFSVQNQPGKIIDIIISIWIYARQLFGATGKVKFLYD